MNSKISAILGAICLLLLISNHYLINWEDFTKKRVESDFYDLIERQRVDLLAWSERQNLDPEFRKRTLCKGRLVEWSDDHPFIYSHLSDSIDLIETENGLILFQSVDVGGCTFISGYPLINRYSIANQYLKNGKGKDLNSALISITTKGGPYSFNDLFYYNFESGPNRAIDAIISVIIIVILLVEYWRISNLKFSYFLIATMSLVGLRLISLSFNSLEILFRYELFDPLFYTASYVVPTLGDLLLNMILALMVATLICRYLKEFEFRFGWFVLGGVGICLSLLIYYVPYSILVNSQITLDVGESIQFTFLRIVAYMCILIVAVAYFIFLFFLQQYLIRHNKLLYAVGVSILVGIVLLFLNYLLAIPTFVHGLLLLISLKMNWNGSLRDFNYSSLLYILLIAVSVGGICSFIAYKYWERSELESKKKFANYLLIKRDVLGEYYLDQSLKKLARDTSLQQIASEGSKAQLLAKIEQEFISPYFNKYDLEILFQDFQVLKINNRFTREYSQLIPENKSDYDDIFFIDDGTNFKYISKVNFGDLVGLIILQIKKRVPSNVYPALLTDSKYAPITDDFDYAVFARDEILFHRSKFGQGEWPQSEDFENADLYDEGIEKNERHYFGIETSDGRTILIISQKYSIRAFLSNFSFFFLIVLSALGFYSATNSVREKGFTFNFTSKIQFYLTLAFVIPLLSTGFALLSSLNTSYREEIDRSYLKQALYISDILSHDLELEDSELIDANQLVTIGSFIQSDISYYNASGYLVATSQPDIFTLGLQSNLVNPIVFDELIMKQNQSMIADESIGSLDYKVCYAQVNTSDNQVAGFIAMPFFNSKNHLRRQQIEVFGNLISIFGLIFILALLIGNVIINNLLFPLRMVAGEIRHITLQDVNKPIKYESSDDIGSLVKDYNQMLVKLEDSKRALAKSQKETAWKEIARQVAHEIKNPLTPMTLKIQQMLRKYEDGSKDHETLSSLLTQVDTLSQIAESFSAFAEMPAPDNQVFSWKELVDEVLRLYRSKDVKISFECDEEVSIEADVDIFRRILINIVLNAIQSVDKSLAEIDIKLEKKAGKAVLSVSDNGKGVPEELRDKIFLNYFSTKSTGSGIGLALAKKGIENAGGNIWFESNQGQGTTFFISMPLVHS